MLHAVSCSVMRFAPSQGYAKRCRVVANAFAKGHLLSALEAARLSMLDFMTAAVVAQSCSIAVVCL